MKQRVVILGSTGSIGTSTLDVIGRHPERFEVLALTAAKQVDLLLQQCLTFKPLFAVMVQAEPAKALADQLKAAGSKTRVLQGAQALVEVVSFFRLHGHAA